MAQERPDHNVLPRRQSDQRLGDLEGTPDAALRAGVRRQIVDQILAQDDRARARLELPADQIEQRRLAGAVRSDQAQDLAAVHLKRHAVHCEQPGEARLACSTRRKLIAAPSGGSPR
jgi:hypothetical protein